MVGFMVLAASLFVLVFTAVFYSSMDKVDYRNCDEYMVTEFFPEIDGAYDMFIVDTGYCRYTSIAYATDTVTMQAGGETFLLANPGLSSLVLGSSTGSSKTTINSGKGMDIDITVGQGYELDRPSQLYLRAAQTGGKIKVRVGGKVIPIADGNWY